MPVMMGNNKKSRGGGTPFLHEMKKHASTFVKDKIRTARLALTNVTAAELLAEEATNKNPLGPDTRVMNIISKAAFEADEYWRIVDVLRKRLSRFDGKHWRESYKALILLEHLLTHGPESFSEEFRSDGDVIREVGSFWFIDESGFNWGLAVRKKSERVLKLLEKGPLFREERERCRKLTRGIQGFGSCSERSSTSSLSLSSYSSSSLSASAAQLDSVGYDEKENSNCSSAGKVTVNREAETQEDPLKENTNYFKRLSSGTKLAGVKRRKVILEESKPLLLCWQGEDSIVPANQS